MTAATDAGRMRVWQTEPCPEWCVIEHKDHDHPEDRDHMGTDLCVRAHLAPAVKMSDGTVEASAWKVYLRQPQTGRPIVHLYNDDGLHMWADFLPDEARQLVEVLQLVLGQIGGAK